MPIRNHFLTATLFVALSVSSCPGWAQNTELDRIQTQNQELQEEYDILESRLQRQQADLEEANQTLSKTVIEMTEVFARAKAEPTERNVRQATLISITHNRKLNRVERVENRITDTQSRLQGISLTLEKLSKRKAEEKRKLALQEKRHQEQQRLAKQVAKAKQQAVQQKLAAAPTNRPATKSKPLQQKAPATVSRKPGWPELKQPHKDDIQFARATISTAQKQLEKGGKALLPKVYVIAKQSFGSKRMRYIGDDLYSVTAPLKAGNQKLTLFKTDFWVDIPKANDRQQHRIIYDTTSLSKPLLHIIREEQLEGS